MKNTFEVALLKEACIVCGKMFNGPIVMNSVLTERLANEVKSMHGKCAGFMKDPCKECQEDLKKCFMLIEADFSKGDISSNPYRTGNMWGVSFDYANRLFANKPPKQGFAFIDIKDADSIGIKEVQNGMGEV